MKKLKTIAMSVLMMLLMITATGKEVQADTTDTTLGQGITNVSVRDTSTLGAIDPASFYSVIGDMVLDIKFEDGQSLALDRWQLAYSLEWDGGDNYDHVSRGYLSNPYYDYLVYMYDANGEQVFLDYDFFEVGEGYVLKFYRGYDQTNLVFEQEINIAAPAEFGEIKDGKVEFNTSDTDEFETIWYPIPSDTKLNTEYKISRTDFSSDEIWRNHVSIWKYENGQATRINEGLQSQDQQTFAHTFTEVENVYLVIGEKDKSMNISGTISMKEVRMLESIELNPYTCSVWNGEQYHMPVTVHYTDGSSDTYKDWMSTLDLENANGDGQVVDVEGFEMTTPNGDKLVLGFQDNAGNWIEIGNSREWKAGTYKAVAYLLNDRNNCSESTITVEEPEATELDLDVYQTEGVSVSAGEEAYYKITVTGEEKKILLINNSPNKLYYRSYSRTPGSDEAWERYYNEYEVDGDEIIRFKNGNEYLIIIYTDAEAAGTIGRYADKSKVKSAEVLIDELDLTDLSIWNTLPIKVNFVSPDDSSVQTGWQMLNNWEVMSYSDNAYTWTAYVERIYYVLYKDGEPYFIPSENTIDKLRCGDYEIKVYKESIDEANLIGSKKIKTNFTHEWEELDYEPATCSAEGEITYWCPKCHKVKREAIPKTGHNYSTSWTIDKKATTTANGSKSKHCKNCDAKTSVTTIKKASKVSLATATYVYNGNVKSPTVIVKDSAGNKIATTNYTVTKPTGRKNVGKYTYKIKFKNQYSGTKNLTLTINPKGTSIVSLTKASKAFTVKWKKQATQTTGYQICYGTSTNKNNCKKVLVTSNKTLSKKITGLKSGKKYYVWIRTYKTVNGTKYYSAWSARKSVTTK